MKEGFNPVLVDEIQITWIYFSALHESLVNGVFSDISHHIVLSVNKFAHISIIYPQKF